MFKGALRAFAILSVFAVSMVASAQLKFDYIGLEVGAYFPTGGTLKDKFGSEILRFGISPVTNRRTPDWRLSYEFGFIGAEDGDDEFKIIPFTVGFQKSFGEQGEGWVPYLRGGLGVAYFDFDIDGEDDTKISGAASLEAGLLAGERFKLSARYYIFPEQKGIDFNGFLISASYGIFKM